MDQSSPSQKGYVQISKRGPGCKKIKQNVSGGMVLAPCIASILDQLIEKFINIDISPISMYILILTMKYGIKLE